MPSLPSKTAKLGVYDVDSNSWTKTILRQSFGTKKEEMDGFFSASFSNKICPSQVSQPHMKGVKASARTPLRPARTSDPNVKRKHGDENCLVVI